MKIMRKKVLASVTGMQEDISSKEVEQIHFLTRGEYYEKDGYQYIDYEEQKMEDQNGIISTMKMMPDRIILDRSGENNAHMVFEQGKKYISQYETFFGIMELGITTKEMLISIKDGEGLVKIKYALEVNKKALSDNEFTIKIEEDIL